MNQNNRLHLIYVLPNLFTAASAFVGVLSIIASTKGDYERAAWLILISLVLDGLDGRIARLTRTTSRFGLEFDSLADIVAFGVAPALLLYFCCGSDFGKFGATVAGMFVVFGAIRLARFNVMAGVTEPSVFIGVPIPTAAVFVSAWVLMVESYGFLRSYTPALMGAAVLVSLLMVSNIRYPSFKKIDLKKANVTKILVFLIVLFGLLYQFPIEGMAMVVTLYVLYGPARALYNIILIRRKKKV